MIKEEKLRVEIYMSCWDLKSNDKYSRCDPQIILYLLNENDNEYYEYARTDVLKNNVSPKFPKPFLIDYIFEKSQMLKFVVMDVDKQNHSSQVLGQCLTSVSRIVGSQNMNIIVNLYDQYALLSGKMMLDATNRGHSGETIELQLSIKNLVNKSLFGMIGLSSPFIKISKNKVNNQEQIIDDEIYEKSYQTEYVRRSKNPKFKLFQIPTTKLCCANYDMPIKFEVFDHNIFGFHTYCGEVLLTLEQLIFEKKHNFQLLHKTKQQKAGIHLNIESNQQSKQGILSITNVNLISESQIIDYIRDGYHLSTTISIDFSLSNKEQKNPLSSHFIHEGFKLNEYQEALLASACILINYDYDQQIGLYGFGGIPRLPNLYTNEVLHFFPVTGNIESPEVKGLDGMMAAYKNIINYIDFSGPTLLSPMVKEMNKLAQQMKDDFQKEYLVSVILTDGDIKDMDETIEQLFESQHLPISIIIIGMGSNTFKDMKILDGDTHKLKNSKGVLIQRDLIQFLEFKEYKDNIPLLTRKMLEELPNQFIEYMKHQNLKVSQQNRKNEKDQKIFQEKDQQLEQQQLKDGIVNLDELKQIQKNNEFLFNRQFGSIKGFKEKVIKDLKQIQQEAEFLQEQRQKHAQLNNNLRRFEENMINSKRIKFQCNELEMEIIPKSFARANPIVWQNQKDNYYDDTIKLHLSQYQEFIQPISQSPQKSIRRSILSQSNSVQRHRSSQYKIQQNSQIDPQDKINQSIKLSQNSIAFNQEAIRLSNLPLQTSQNFDY